MGCCGSKRLKKRKSKLKNKSLKKKEMEKKEDERKEKMETVNESKTDGSGYGNVVTKQSLKNKSLPETEYNDKGLIDINSPEYAKVKEYLAKKNYTLQESIGSGNYAEVYKAVNESNKTVAVKVIPLKKAEGNYRMNFLPREIVILRNVRHPNVIKMYEVSQTKNNVYMFMEFATEGTAADVLRKIGPFSEHFAWHVFKHILSALHCMHEMKCAHRDIKMENILITKNNVPKLSDFSYAVEVTDKNRLSTTFCGSVPYFSPEILQRKPYDPFLSDVWSLGVCLYIMTNDALPFTSRDDKLMLTQQLNHDWRFKKKYEPNLSIDLKNFVSKMLDPDVNSRATTQTLIYDNWITSEPKK